MNMTVHTPSPGDCRITVPIPSSRISEAYRSDIEYPCRRVLSQGFEVAVLDEREQQRLESSPYAIATNWRLEIFNRIERWECEKWSADVHERVDGLVTSALAKLSLCVREYFPGEYIVVDEFDGIEWRHVTNIQTTDRTYSGAVAWVPVERLRSWGDLIDNWPDEPDESLNLALAYYRESVLQRRARRLSSAIVSAAIATEILFGDVNSELTHRISVRSAQLVSAGEDAIRVQQVVKKLYALRSKVVHTGKGADVHRVDLWHRFLMHAIPAVAAWGGSLDSLRRALDESTFIRSDDLARLQVRGEWWGFCDFVSCLDGSSIQ